MRTDLLALGALCSALLSAAPAAAQTSPVEIRNEVLVERTVTTPDGRRITQTSAPTSVVPGERLLFRLHYRNAGQRPANDFVLTNPMPQAVAYSEGASGGAAFSVDGGQSWGPLATLKVKAPDGSDRAAEPCDVTHIRWAFTQPIAVGAGGTVSFVGVVR